MRRCDCFTCTGGRCQHVQWLHVDERSDCVGNPERNECSGPRVALGVWDKDLSTQKGAYPSQLVFTAAFCTRSLFSGGPPLYWSDWSGHKVLEWVL
jgi:hypothetical protein